MVIDNSYYQMEILEQPKVLGRLLKEGISAVEQVAGAIRERGPQYIVIAARGTSDNAARYAQYLFGTANGLPVALATPSLFTLYGNPPRLGGALVLGISQSGQSPDVVSVIKEGRRQGALTVAITNDLHSPLAHAAEYTICLLAGQEKALAASKTYTASLMVLAMLSTVLSGDGERLQALEALPDLVAGVIDSSQSAVRAAERYRYIEACMVISRGYNYSTAFEIALKLKELAYILAEPYSSADCQHGPVALIERGFPVLAVVPEGYLQDELTDFLGRLRERGAELVIISALDKALALAKTPLPLPSGLAEWLSPIAAVVPGQLFALGLTISKGLDPDNPRGLNKVTLTM